MNVRDKLTQVDQEIRGIDRELAKLTSGRDPLDNDVPDEIAGVVRPRRPVSGLQPAIEQRMTRKRDLERVRESLKKLMDGGVTVI